MVFVSTAGTIPLALVDRSRASNAQITRLLLMLAHASWWRGATIRLFSRSKGTGVSPRRTERIIQALAKASSGLACSIRVSTSVFERIWRIVRKPKALKFFAFNTRQGRESPTFARVTRERATVGTPASSLPCAQQRARRASAQLALSVAFLRDPPSLGAIRRFRHFQLRAQ